MFKNQSRNTRTTKDAPPIDFAALAAQLVTQLAGPAEIETPQLGRVVYPTAQNTIAALGVPAAGGCACGWNLNRGSDDNNFGSRTLMKNFVQPGNMVTVTSPTNATSGDLVLFGVMGGGVAGTDALVGQTLELAVEGTFDLKKVTADLQPAGTVAKADSATGLISLAGTIKVGWILQTSGAGQTTVRVRLCPGIAG